MRVSKGDSVGYVTRQDLPKASILYVESIQSKVSLKILSYF